MKQKIRTFVAVEIEPAVREMTAQLVETLAGAGANVRWVEPHNMHLTLKFLGDVDSREIHEVCRAVETAVAPLAPFSLELRGSGAFPNVRRPRTLWLGTGEGSDEVAAMSQRVETELHRLGYPREGRRFHGHLTLGRVRQGDAGLSRLAELLAEYDDFQAGRSQVSEVVVFSSQLDRGGPTYEPLGRAKLAGGE